MFRELCGDPTLKNVILTTNMWGAVSHEVGEIREKELSGSSFKPALDMGARIIRHQNTPQSARDIIRVIMANHPDSLSSQTPYVQVLFCLAPAVADALES